MNKLLKWVFIIVIVGLVIYFISSIAISSMFDVGDGKSYSKEDLINNYRNKQASIDSLKDYYNKLVPADRIIEIEFKSDKEIDRLAATNLKTNSPNYSDQYFCSWDLNVKSQKVDSIIHSIGWTQQTLAEIKLRLDKANCIGILNGEPIIINFQRSGFGMYSYDMFSNSIPDSLRKKYNDSCTHILYNDKVVLEYGGGAIGPQCFPKKIK